jgi:hypothetical protein
MPEPILPVEDDIPAPILPTDEPLPSPILDLKGDTEKAAKTAYEWGMKQVERPFQAIKGAVAGAFEGKNPLVEAGRGFVGDRDTNMSDLVTKTSNQMGSRVDPELQKSASEATGFVGELAADPINFITPFSVTKAGQEAANIGRELPTLAQKADAGHMALIGLGETPLIEGAPVLRGMTAVNQALDKVPLVEGIKAGFKPALHTDNAAFNWDTEEKLRSPENYGVVTANAQKAADADEIGIVSKKYGVKPEEINKQILDYIEPRGSQTAEESDIPKLILSRDSLVLQPETKAIADRMIEQNKTLAESEKGVKDYPERPFYFHHDLAPEYKDFVEKKIGKDKMGDLVPQTSSSLDPTKTTISAFKKRTMPYTVNEINNISREGRLSEIFQNAPEFKDYKGRVFSDDVAAVQSKRYLDSVKATTRDQYVKHITSAYGMPEKAFQEAVRKGDVKNIEWGKLGKPVNGETVYFPKEIADGLNRVDWITANPQHTNALKNAINTMNNYVKSTFYGIYPSSAITNEASNQVMQFLHGAWDPMSNLQGKVLALKEKTGKLSDAPFLATKKYGMLTEKQFVELMQKNRGTGMGLARFEREGMPDAGKGIKGALGPRGKVLSVMNPIQDYIEASNRYAVEATALKRGMDAKGAAALSRKVLLDYSEMGPTDEAIRKYAFPFWTFTRKNMPNMLKVAVQKPAQTAAYGKIHNEVNKGVKDQEANQDDYMRQSMPVYLGKNKDGQDWYWYLNRYMTQLDINKWLGTGKNPWEVLKNTVNQTGDQLAGMISPVPKEIIQQAMNRDFFMHKPIEKTPGQVADVLPGVALPVRLTHMLNAARPISEVGRLVTPRGGQNASTLENAAGLTDSLTGFKARPFDEEQQGRIAAMSDYYNKKDLYGIAVKYLKDEAKYRNAGQLYKAIEAKKNAEIALKNLHEATQNGVK